MARGIALLGWGSLLWEGASTFDDWHEPWQYDGPCLAMEFTRVSCSRAGALTLVIDPDNGVPIEVAWCLSRRQTVAEAIEGLCKREQTTTKHIGRIVADGQVQCHDGESRQAIHTWVEERKLAGVVWTDLRSNFRPKRGEPFSIDAAMRYLKCLEGESRTKAFEYFQRAPSFVRTPLRDTFNKEIGEIAASNS